MPEDEPRRAESWVVGSWLRPALVTLVALAAAGGTMHRHRDAGSVLAALVCGLFVVHVWRVWVAARAPRPPRRLSE